jgi:hypothetical protein
MKTFSVVIIILISLLVLIGDKKPVPVEVV